MYRKAIVSIATQPTLPSSNLNPQETDVIDRSGKKYQHRNTSKFTNRDSLDIMVQILDFVSNKNQMTNRERPSSTYNHTKYESIQHNTDTRVSWTIVSWLRLNVNLSNALMKQYISDLVRLGLVRMEERELKRMGKSKKSTTKPKKWQLVITEKGEKFQELAHGMQDMVNCVPHSRE